MVSCASSSSSLSPWIVEAWFFTFWSSEPICDFYFEVSDIKLLTWEFKSSIFSSFSLNSYDSDLPLDSKVDTFYFKDEISAEVAAYKSLKD